MIFSNRASLARPNFLFAVCLLGFCHEVAAIGSPFKSSRRCDASVACEATDFADSPVCGTDGRNYDTQCDLKRVNCLGKLVKVHHEGVCSNIEKCALDRSFQMALYVEDDDVFVPKCNESDGSYSQIQCHKSTGYCWCVSKEGRPISKSSSLNAMPNCEEFVSSKVGRRSNRRKTQVERADPKSCTTLDRSTFNDNLINLFVKEYNRVPEEVRSDEASNLTLEKRAMHWKFSELDSDRNDAISKTEIDGLRRLVRHYVKPAACAKQFPVVCDSDQDGAVGRDEWILCLGNEFSKVAIQHVKASYRILHTLRPERRPPRLRNITSSAFNLLRNAPVKIPGKPAAIAASPSQPSKPTQPPSNDFLANRRPASIGGSRLPANPREEEAADRPLDCITQRRQIVARHGNDSQLNVYVPVCTGTDDKLFDVVQCHKQTGFCWCVNQWTNDPIPHTSMQHEKPNCTALRLKPHVSSATGRQTIKGCKPRKQLAFFQRLFRSIETEMIAAIGPRALQQRVDRISKWKFRQLDANRNNILEKDEWKPYRAELRHFHKMRKCGRNFFRFCDRDRNKKITLDEWRRCTVNAAKKKPPRKVKTQNPFLYILRPDD